MKEHGKRIFDSDSPWKLAKHGLLWSKKNQVKCFLLPEITLDAQLFFSKAQFWNAFDNNHLLIKIGPQDNWDDYSQLGATRLVGYLSFHIQRALVE